MYLFQKTINCQAQVQSQIQVPNPKSKVQRKGNGTGADNIILQATTPPNTPNFSHLKCKSSDGKRPSMTFLDLPWPSMNFHDLLWPSMTFYHLLRPLWPSMINCLLSRRGLISGPLQSSPAQVNSQSILSTLFNEIFLREAFEKKFEE